MKNYLTISISIFVVIYFAGFAITTAYSLSEKEKEKLYFEGKASCFNQNKDNGFCECIGQRFSEYSALQVDDITNSFDKTKGEEYYRNLISQVTVDFI